MLSGIVTTKYGKIGGIAAGGCLVYRGIPYAKPPVGALRFRPPEPPEGWDGVYAATRFPNRAPQADVGEMPFYGKEFYSQPEYQTPCSEDCLYLNIWTPADAAGKQFPVAFWIHGGAFSHGFGHELEFDGTAYAKKGVILVTINYRVGVLGYLAHPWLSERDAAGRSGNYGSLDQIAALAWVRENIAAFGGDRDNITVFGQSAGSMAAQALAGSALTEGMFRRCILQSGGGYRTGMLQAIPLAEAEAQGARFIEALGIRSCEELMEAAPETLYLGQEREMLFLNPIVDGYLLEDTADRLLEQGRQHKIAYMLGSTKNDLRRMTGMDPRAFYDNVVAWCEKRGERGEAPSHVYYFSRDLPGDDAGAFHSSELWYTFGTLGRCWRPMTAHDYALSEEMVSAWTNFMKTGDPGWKPYTREAPFIREFR